MPRGFVPLFQVYRAKHSRKLSDRSGIVCASSFNPLSARQAWRVGVDDCQSSASWITAQAARSDTLKDPGVCAWPTIPPQASHDSTRYLHKWASIIRVSLRKPLVGHTCTYVELNAGLVSRSSASPLALTTVPSIGRRRHFPSFLSISFPCDASFARRT